MFLKWPSHTFVTFELRQTIISNNKWKMGQIYLNITAKRILDRLGTQTLSKFDRSIFQILKPSSYFFGLVF